jgi:flagellar basal-body rod protein FlgF
MAINEHRQDVIANNLANVDTVGFKRDLAVFEERLQEAKFGAGNARFLPENLYDATGGAFAGETYTDFTMGAIKTTDNNLDVALAGSGFLTVQDGDEARYSRDGQLGIVENKLVRAIDGKAILDDKGREIILPNVPVRDIHIDSEGMIRVGDNLIATLGIVDFADKQGLSKVGGNLYDAMDQTPQATKTPIISGAIEQSTVNPSKELIEMIKVSRNHQINASMLTLQDETLSRLINELPKL